jgi:ornithine cyclodeaminase
MKIKGQSEAHHLDVVGAADLAKLISMPEAIVLLEEAMRDLSAGIVWAPSRWTDPISSVGRITLMPGGNRRYDQFGLKVLSLFDKEARGGLPGHQGMMLLFDGATGQPITAIEASALTSLRTAAASALATRTLARADASSMAILGCGEQARRHAEAIPLVRGINKAWVWSRRTDDARKFAQQHLSHIAEVVVATTVEAAVRDADIITAATHADEPILSGDWLRPGQHLNLVGSSTAASREADTSVVERGCFVVDFRPNALVQGGELVHAINSGVVSPDHIHGELGEILLGLLPGRASTQAITIYKSLGHVAQDLVVAHAVNEKLLERNWPYRVPWRSAPAS